MLEINFFSENEIQNTDINVKIEVEKFLHISTILYMIQKNEIE